MATKVLLTIDTELVWRHHAAGLGWRDNFARSCEAAGVGLSFQLATLAAHGLRACFFVDPMPALLFGLEPVRRMVEPILAAGQEVQLHLHPFWHGLAAGEEPAFELTGLPFERQLELVRTARDLLLEAGAPPPIAFRAGSYAADLDTLAALAEIGMSYDSSHNGSFSPWPSALPLDPAAIDPVEIGGVVEIPVTQIAQRRGVRHLQICAVSNRELAAALDHAAASERPVTTIVGHSFELATRDGLRANGTVRRRFERLCALLGERRGDMPTVTFADLGDLPLGDRAPPLAPNRFQTAQRMAEQLWSNARYERPGATAAAAAAGSAAGLAMVASLVDI